MADANRIARLLDPESIVIFDGAMGTMLYSRGVFINQCYDELNLRAPDLVRDIHRQYVSAGAEVLETNSFGANRLKLTQHGLQDQVKELNRAAAKVAREAANDPAQPGCEQVKSTRFSPPPAYERAVFASSKTW